MTLQGKLITTKGVSTRILLSAFLDRSRGLHETKQEELKTNFQVTIEPVEYRFFPSASFF